MEKKQLNTRQLLKDLAVILGGSIVGALGSKLLFSSAMGVAPIFMVDEGICKIFHVSLGTAIWSICAFFLLLGLLLDRRSIGLATVVTSLVSGVFIDHWALVIPAAPEDLSVRVIFMLAGIVYSSLGAAIYLRPGRGGSCVEIVMLCLCRRTGIPIGAARMISDALWFGIGWTLGGTWGWGTLASLALSGGLLQFFIKCLDKLQKKRLTA